MQVKDPTWTIFNDTASAFWLKLVWNDGHDIDRDWFSTTSSTKGIFYIPVEAIGKDHYQVPSTAIEGIVITSSGICIDYFEFAEGFFLNSSTGTYYTK